MTTCVQSKHPTLDCPWRCSPAYNQSSYKSSRHIDGTELPPCVWIYWSVQTKWFWTLVKMLLEGNERTFGVPWTTVSWQSLDERVLDKSFWALGSPINLDISTSTKICLQFISTILHTFNAIEIIAFFRAQFPSASISSPMGFRISHVAFNYPSFLATLSLSLCTKQQRYACWKCCWWRLGNVHHVGTRFWAIQRHKW